MPNYKTSIPPKLHCQGSMLISSHPQKSASEPPLASINKQSSKLPLQRSNFYTTNKFEHNPLMNTSTLTHILNLLQERIMALEQLQCCSGFYEILFICSAFMHVIVVLMRYINVNIISFKTLTFDMPSLWLTILLFDFPG